MNKNLLLLTTRHGGSYAKKVGFAYRRLGSGRHYRFFCDSIPLAFRMHPEWNQHNLLIHSRAANPNANWMNNLVDLERQGYRVINCTSSLKMTSDKWQSVKELTAAGVGNIPHTGIVSKRKLNKELIKEIYEEINTPIVIVKPRVSQGQGQFVKRIQKRTAVQDFIDTVADIPTQDLIIQDFIPYDVIYRVFVIHGKALPIVTKDLPDAHNWKVSVCLNKDQIVDRNPPKELLKFAEDIQVAVAGEINFIDIFGVKDGFVLSEVNTACNLKIHEKLTGLPLSDLIAEYLEGVKI